MKWEYLFQESPVGPEFGAFLASHGVEGWELVSAQQGVLQRLAGVGQAVWITIFKRPLVTPEAK